MNIPSIPPPIDIVPSEELPYNERMFRASCNVNPLHYTRVVEPVPEWTALLSKVAELLARPSAIVVATGPRGTGKTQAAAEIMRAYHRANRFPLYRTAKEFFGLLRASFSSSETSEHTIIAQHIAPQLLVLDEIQVRGDTTYELDTLTHLIDARYAAMKRKLLISNLPKRSTANGGPCIEDSLGASIISRIQETGAVVVFDCKSFRG